MEFLNIYSISPVLAGIVFGGLWQVFRSVWSTYYFLLFLAIMNLAAGHPDPILSFTSILFAFFSKQQLYLL